MDFDKAILWHYSLFVPLENIRKPEIFQGREGFLEKGTFVKISSTKHERPRE